ncbi:MAG: hypothetical protein Tsb0015_17370 [Simkaniaceae bacterium]
MNFFSLFGLRLNIRNNLTKSADLFRPKFIFDLAKLTSISKRIFVWKISRSLVRLFLAFSIIILFCFGLSSCSHRSSSQEEHLTSIQFIDRHGVRETISTKERLKNFEKSDFLSPQPFEKVVRIFGKNEEGKALSKLTSYHANGQIKQYLEIVGGRAKGKYQEWYENGNPKIILNVIEGIGDLNQAALQSFMLDGISQAFDENGNLQAQFVYDKGALQGDAFFYYPNKKIQSRTPFRSNKIQGIVAQYNEDGEIIGESEYDLGLLHGKSYFKGNKEKPPFQEIYEKGKIIHGRYFNFDNKLVSQVESGRGMKSYFENGKLVRQCEVAKGILEGKVKVFNNLGEVESIYHIKDGEKHGDEWIYYPKTEQIKIQMVWYEGEVHGVVKTWYENGKLESEKEFSHNKKHGMNFSWYKDGSLMMVEEYENDLLKKGSYYKRGHDSPISKIVNGNGEATLYDADGYFIRKVEYQNGQPFET